MNNLVENNDVGARTPLESESEEKKKKNLCGQCEDGLIREQLED